MGMYYAVSFDDAIIPPARYDEAITFLLEHSYYRGEPLTSKPEQIAAYLESALADTGAVFKVGNDGIYISGLDLEVGANDDVDETPQGVLALCEPGMLIPPVRYDEVIALLGKSTNLAEVIQKTQAEQIVTLLEDTLTDNNNAAVITDDGIDISNLGYWDSSSYGFDETLQGILQLCKPGATLTYSTDTEDVSEPYLYRVELDGTIKYYEAETVWNIPPLDGSDPVKTVLVSDLADIVNDPQRGVISLVGGHGGKSLITGEIAPSNVIAGTTAIETEHGTIYLDSETEILVEER